MVASTAPKPPNPRPAFPDPPCPTPVASPPIPPVVFEGPSPSIFYRFAETQSGLEVKVDFSRLETGAAVFIGCFPEARGAALPLLLNLPPCPLAALEPREVKDGNEESGKEGVKYFLPPPSPPLPFCGLRNLHTNITSRNKTKIDPMPTKKKTRLVP